jgi:protease I
LKALILCADGFEDLELLYPLYRLREEGVEVKVASPDGDRITGEHGYVVPADLDYGDVNPADFDLLIIPGGKAPETVRLREEARDHARTFFDSGKIVAAICHGPQVLITAGVLSGRNVTCAPGIRDDVRAAGAVYRDRAVVVDDNLITSRAPGDLPAFCREITSALRTGAR